MPFIISLLNAIFLKHIIFFSLLFNCRIGYFYRLLEIVNLYLANTAECRLSEKQWCRLSFHNAGMNILQLNFSNGYFLKIDYCTSNDIA